MHQQVISSGKSVYQMSFQGVNTNRFIMVFSFRAENTVQVYLVTEKGTFHILLLSCHRIKGRAQMILGHICISLHSFWYIYSLGLTTFQLCSYVLEKVTLPFPRYWRFRSIISPGLPQLSFGPVSTSFLFHALQLCKTSASLPLRLSAEPSFQVGFRWPCCQSSTMRRLMAGSSSVTLSINFCFVSHCLATTYGKETICYFFSL